MITLLLAPPVAEGAMDDPGEAAEKIERVGRLAGRQKLARPVADLVFGIGAVAFEAEREIGAFAGAVIEGKAGGMGLEVVGRDLRRRLLPANDTIDA